MEVEVNNIRLYYEDQGSGKPIVLIHGFPFDHHLWDPQVEILAEKYRVIVPDLRGFGQSDAPEGPYSMTQNAADVIALLDLLQIQRAIIGGISMGGYISLAIAEQYPERLEGLILSNTRTAKDTAAIRQNRYNTVEKVKFEGTSFLIRDMLEKVLSKKTQKHHPEILQFVEQMMQRQQATGIVGAEQGMAQRRDRSFILNEIQVPVMVIAGRDDNIISPMEAKRIAKEVPLGHLEIIPDAGHLSNLEQPDQYNNLLLRFIESTEVVEH